MMEKVSGFIIVWKLRFHTIINAPRGSHCSGMEECRLRDPPQAENPASQDSFLYSQGASASGTLMKEEIT